MALESSELVVTGTGHIYVAPVGTAFPASIDAVVSHNVGWIDLGYATEEGARFSFGREINEAFGWQSADPLRLISTRRPKSVAFDLMQWNQHTVQLALGGGTVTEPVSGQYEYAPPADSYIDERALIVEGTDGDYTYRFCYRKAFNQATVEFAFVRENPVVFPIDMKILAADGGLSPYIVQTDDPNIGEILEAAS